jgi:Zn-dependent metalloprotease
VNDPKRIHLGPSRCPILCILPPHILKNLAQITDRKWKRLAEWAWRTLLISEQFRGCRQAIGTIATEVMTPTGGKRRTVYDARNTETLPGKLARSEGQPAVRDSTVNEAYDGAGATYDLYATEYRRSSIDDRGLRLDSTVHYGKKYDNAFWDGRQMVYGDGDGVIFNRFTKAIDVIGHELTHGVTQYEAGLLYQGEPGALNESFSDVFGALVKQRKLGQTAAKADWLIGKGLLLPGVQGVALRSMKAPGTAYDDPRIGKDPQPAHMRDYVHTDDDNGGVHINSGIPNHAFYLAASAVGGDAWRKAGKIWYLALRDRLRPAARFRDAAQATLLVAVELHGEGSTEARAVREAWREVGVALPRPKLPRRAPRAGKKRPKRPAKKKRR